jgi:hypothetical protein
MDGLICSERKKETNKQTNKNSNKPTLKISHGETKMDTLTVANCSWVTRRAEESCQ